jgi:hypothetical protein
MDRSGREQSVEYHRTLQWLDANRLILGARIT